MLTATGNRGNIKRQCHGETCEKNGKKMKPAKVGFNEYFVEAETCRNYSTEKKAESDKKKKELSEEQKEAVALAKKLAEKNQTLTFYCCHCGAPIKIGAKVAEIPKKVIGSFICPA